MHTEPETAPRPIGHHSNGMPIWPPGAMKKLGQDAGARLLSILQQKPDDPENDPFHRYWKNQQRTA